MSPIKRLSTTVLVAALLLGSSSASAGTEQLRFTHEHSTQIAEYRAVLGYAPGRYTQERSLGVPPKTSGVFSASIEIPNDIDVFVAIVAVDSNGNRSAPSNEQLRFFPSNLLGAPGQPVLQGQ